MNEIKRKANINRAIQVINRTQEGLTISNACKEVGLPRSSYYYIVETEQEALSLIQNMIYAHHVENLGRILDNQVTVLEKVIEDGLSEKTKPRERIAIHKYLNQRNQELMNGLKDSTNANQALKSDFTGPLLHPGTSSNVIKTKYIEK